MTYWFAAGRASGWPGSATPADDAEMLSSVALLSKSWGSCARAAGGETSVQAMRTAHGRLRYRKIGSPVMRNGEPRRRRAACTIGCGIGEGSNGRSGTAVHLTTRPGAAQPAAQSG